MTKTEVVRGVVGGLTGVALLFASCSFIDNPLLSIVVIAVCMLPFVWAVWYERFQHPERYMPQRKLTEDEEARDAIAGSLLLDDWKH